MSQASVEIVRDIYDELARGNYAPFRDALHPEIVYWLRSEDPEPGPYRGRDAAMDLVGQPVHDDVFVELHTEARDVIGAGEWVFAWVRASGRGRASGAPFEIEGAIVHRFEGGRIVEMREYAERTEALEAVGLRE